MSLNLNIIMKHTILILSLLLLVSCNSKEDVLNSGDSLSLNGTWKFHTIYGEGYNYLDTKETENDIVIDNNSEDVVLQGKWKPSKKAARFTHFYGKDYLQHNFSETSFINGERLDSSYVRFYPKFKKSGYYEAFTRHPFSSHLTAQLNVNHAKGTTTKYVSQRVFCNEWVSLGIYKFNTKEDNYIELTAITGGTVAADAVMFKEISEAKFLTAKKEPHEVYKKEFDDSKWYDIKVPGHWGMINHFSNYTGIGWYRKTIDLPKSWTKTNDARYYLKFDGVYHLSKIYLNGKFIGKNRGGFTPFEFDVTNALNFNGVNSIAVQADNSAIVGATWNWGGIIRDVTLTKTKDVRIDYQYMHAEPDLKTGIATLKLRLKIENNSSDKRTIDVSSKVFNQKEITNLNGSVEIEPNTTQIIHLESKLNAKHVKLWHFDHPNLYKLKTTISENGIILNERADNFGIRKIELTDSKLLLNGEPVRLAGFNRVSEHRFWGSSEPIEVLEKDVDLMKEAGANFMRIMHGTQNEKLIELCDKKGILLFEEVNVRDLDNDEFRANYYPLANIEDEKKIQLKSEDEEILVLDQPYIKTSNNVSLPTSNKNYFLSKYWLKGMIERDINHPSIIGWSVGNELNNHNEYAKAAMAYVKTELDPYRLVTCVSNSGQKEQYTPETDPNTHVDIIMHNMYRWQGTPQEILTTLRTKWPNKPIFISEYGFDPFPSTELDGDKEIFSEWMQHYRNKNEFVVGTSMWTFNDYRSGYAGTTAEENRVWGIINSWRQKRRLFNRIKKEHAPIKDIVITNVDFQTKTAEIKIPIKERSDYPSHSMQGYKLSYKLTFKNDKGYKISDNELDLPNLKPEDGEWTGKISWEALSNTPLDLTVSLVTPTGYSRFDKTVSFAVPLTPQIEEIIPGKEAVRVLLNKVPNATEYYVSYINDLGEEVTSAKTITNSIDVNGLSANKEYTFKLYAVNDNGISNPSEDVQISTGDMILPPKIWNGFITDNKLVIGYSSDFDDTNYTIKYGNSKDKLDKEITSNVRGMMSIDLEGEHEVYYKIKREKKAKQSSWSEIKQTTKLNK